MSGSVFFNTTGTPDQKILISKQSSTNAIDSLLSMAAARRSRSSMINKTLDFPRTRKQNKRMGSFFEDPVRNSDSDTTRTSHTTTDENDDSSSILSDSSVLSDSSSIVKPSRSIMSSPVTAAPLKPTHLIHHVNNNDQEDDVTCTESDDGNSSSSMFSDSEQPIVSRNPTPVSSPSPVIIPIAVDARVEKRVFEKRKPVPMNRSLSKIETSFNESCTLEEATSEDDDCTTSEDTGDEASEHQDTLMSVEQIEPAAAISSASSNTCLTDAWIEMQAAVPSESPRETLGDGALRRRLREMRKAIQFLDTKINELYPHYQALDETARLSVLEKMMRTELQSKSKLLTDLTLALQ